MTSASLPYQPQYERGNCGVGFVADRHGRASREILNLGIDALINLEHRGALNADAKTGDGAGILVPLPTRFFARQAEQIAGHAIDPDAAIVIPPRHNARIWQHGNTHAPPHSRDEAIRFIRAHGRPKWKVDSGYHQRSLAETAVFRFKTIFGDHLSTRLLATQATQFGARCRALNIMTHLGMPDSFKVD